MKMDMFPVFTDATGANMLISVGLLPTGRDSPEHRHNFDQVRFLIRGTSDYGQWIMEEGDCGYFPESVAYGPQRQEQDALVLTLQFPGDSGAYYPTPSELAEMTTKLRTADPTFGQGGTGTDADGMERDAFELVWEALRGQRAQYAPPRYAAPIIIKPDHFNWKPSSPGKEVRHLGTFGDSRLEISQVKLSGSAMLGPTNDAKGGTTEFWFLARGELTIGDTRHEPYSGFLFDGGDGPVVADGHAELLVVRFPARFTQTRL